MMNRARVIALLALALVVRALVPTGWMPVATAAGLRIELCGGQAMPPMAAMPAGHGARHDDRGKPAMPDHPCAFAGIGLAADTAPPVAVVAPRPVATAPVLSRAVGVAVGRGLAAPPPPATGPPAIA